MLEQNKNQRTHQSLIASLYSCWQEYKVPAIFYHYTLSVLSKKDKKDQIKLMSKQIKQLKNNNHPYHTIINALDARQRSLSLIKSNIDQLTQSQSVSNLNWSSIGHEVESAGFNIIYQSRSNGRQNRSLIELINHLKMYQRVTYQVILSIFNWQIQLYELGYEGPVQFIYHHQDYLQQINTDTQYITQQYQFIFEDNPFLIFKREHQNTQYALIYKNVKFGSEFAAKIQEALQIISNHHTAMERHRILGRFKQFGSRKSIQKSQNLHKIYCNYNKNSLIIRDHNLKPDKIKMDPSSHFKIISNNNIIINPQITNSNTQRKHPVYLKPMSKDQTQAIKMEQQYQSMTRSASLSDVKINKIKHVPSLVLQTNFTSQLNHGKIMNKKLSLYENLDKAIKYKNNEVKRQQTTPHESIELNQMEQLRLKTPAQIIEDEALESTVTFNYEANISPYEIIKYLRDTVFSHKQINLKQIQVIAKKIISQQQYITLVRITAGQSIAAWIAFKFIPKDLTIRKAVDLIFVHKFYKIPNFEQQLIQQFMRKGYGIVRERGELVHELDLNQKHSHQLLKIKYKVSLNADKQEIKQIVKINQALKESRLLKYYYYSKQSKYHRYCQHLDNYCQIGFQFQQIFKITISNHNYIRARAEKITKINNYYRIEHHINSTDLLIGQTVQDIMQFNTKNQIQFNSSFQSQSEGKYQFLCLPQTKIVHKFVNYQNQPLIVQYITVNGDIPEILSISSQKKNLKNCLFIQKPFCAAIICRNKQDFGKTLAIMIFD